MKRIGYSIVLLLFTFQITQAQIDNAGSGRAIHFDGVNDYIDYGDRYHDLNLPFTVSAWVFLDTDFTNLAAPIFVTNDNYDGSVNLYRGFWFYVTESALFCEYGDGLGGNHPAFRQGKVASIPDIKGRWVNICAVMRSGFSIDLYLNGVNVGGTSSGESGETMANSLPGDRAKSAYQVSNNGTTYRLKGILDEVRLWNRALSADEVRNTMCRKLSGNEPGLIGNWNFDELTGNTVQDKSVNAFHGQLMNSPTRVFSGAPIGNESIYQYQSNWAGTTLTHTRGSETIEVSDITGNPEGVHIYTVNSQPSQTAGLEVLPVSNVYYGVFTAATDNDNLFDLLYSNVNGCGLSTRTDNSISPWVTSPSAVSNVAVKTELIQQLVEGTLDINIGNDEVSCPFVPRTLQPVANPTGFSFTWQDGSNQPTFLASTYGKYWVTVEKECLIDMDTITFSKAPQVDLAFDLGEDVAICPLTSIVLSPLDNPTGFEFTWQDGSNQSSFVVTDYGSYWVIVENECAIGADTLLVLRPEYTTPKIPNVITPNDDALNDFFVIDTQLLGSDLFVYNRWGRQVYQEINYQNTWAGSGLPPGVYYYLIKSPCLDTKKGWLSIIR